MLRLASSFRDGAASTSYATVELVEELTNDIDNPRILVVGIGEIGADVCRNLKDSSVLNNVVITNRTTSKAQLLADDRSCECRRYVLHSRHDGQSGLQSRIRG